MCYGKFFGKIDIINKFFQILVHPDDIPLIVVNISFGIYEWIVISIEDTNILAMYQ